MRFLLVALALLMTAAGTAETITIDTGGDPESRLEIRNVVLPGGEEVVLYVIQGEQVSVTIDDRRLVAKHIEVDLTHRLVRIVGEGSFITPEQSITGVDLSIELEEESLSARDVLIVTEAIDVRGAGASRTPGQIDVVDGAFSPCSRCGQEVEDYGFRAARIELYPGDRLIAYDATVLVRGRGLLSLPLLVVPLARPDRQPRIALAQGTATERAEVALDWPYVAGPDAFGTFSLRYYADVDPAAPGFHPLGGRVTGSYLGGGLDHVFYTDRGEGSFGFFYLPGFAARGTAQREPPRFTVRLAYRTLDEATEPGDGEDGTAPTIDLEVERDDTVRPGITEYGVTLAAVRQGVSGTVTSRGFVDADPADDVTGPGYDDASTPRRTPVRLVLEPEVDRFGVGPLLLRRLALDLGAFEDASNPTNRSAAVRPIVQEGRLLERHALELTPFELWAGLTLQGHSNFQGNYYTTGERLIDWDTRLAAAQDLGIGELGLVFTRDVSEGETPFRFDRIPLRVRTDLTGRLRLEPTPWIAFETQETYVFSDSRRPELEGFGPLESRLDLFGNLAWLRASVENSYDIADGDPGNLEFEVVLSSPGPRPRASLGIEHLHDLAVLPDRLTGLPVNETETRFELSYGVTGLGVDASGGYRYYPPAPEEPDEPEEHWLPFEAGLTLGTLQQSDALPGLRVAYERDLNRHRVDALSYDLRLRLGPVEASAVQRFDLPDGGTASSALAVAYPGVARLEATGFSLVRPQWIGLPSGEPRSTRYTVTLRDAPITGREAWQLRYQTRWDPGLGEDGGFRDTSLEVRARLEDEQVGASRFSVDLISDIRLRDDDVDTSYLRRAGLEFAADIEGRVGIQGELGYRASLEPSTGRLSRSELTIEDLAVTVRAGDQLFVGARLDDVWEFTGTSPSQPAWDWRPELYVVWDRCCWALLGSWDTASGQVRLSVTAPGSEEGLTQEFPTPLILPGREGAGGP